jgi:hypothetical protein
MSDYEELLKKWAREESKQRKGMQQPNLETQRNYQSQINDAINKEDITALKNLLETGAALSDMKVCNRSPLVAPLEPVDKNNAIITAIKKENLTILKMVVCQHDQNMKKQNVLWNPSVRNRFLTYYHSFVIKEHLSEHIKNADILIVFTKLKNSPDKNFDDILKRWDDELKQQKLDQKKQGIIKPIITIIAVIVITAIIAPQLIALIAVLAGVISSALIYNAYKINTENIEVETTQDTSYEEQEKKPNKLELGENRENVSGPYEENKGEMPETNKGNGPNTSI